VLLSQKGKDFVMIHKKRDFEDNYQESEDNEDLEDQFNFYSYFCNQVLYK